MRVLGFCGPHGIDWWVLDCEQSLKCLTKQNICLRVHIVGLKVNQGGILFVLHRQGYALNIHFGNIYLFLSVTVVFGPCIY